MNARSSREIQANVRPSPTSFKTLYIALNLLVAGGRGPHLSAMTRESEILQRKRRSTIVVDSIVETKMKKMAHRHVKVSSIVIQ